VFLTKCNHSLLTAVFGAAENKDTMGLNTVLDEKFSLVLSLGEVFDHDPWANLASKSLNER
jgi:hypothetical protein